jgi:hypothetical protein
MSKKDARREELAKKFPDVEEHFQEVKKGIYQPKIDRLGESSKK